MRRLISSALLLSFVAPSPVRADLRSFTETYEYGTMPAGRTAVELWHTQGRRDWTKATSQSFEQILELEHGLTDRWDVAVYTVFKQVAGDEMTSEPFRFSELKLESRYRLAERGQWPVDTLIYGELAKGFGESTYAVEAKLIGARDFGKATAAVNLIGELKFGKDLPETEVELAWAAGVTYQTTPKLRLGGELFGFAEEGEVGLAIGPAISLALSSNFWIAATGAFGLTDEADAFRARAIIGIEL